jgi:hypothetical protein
MTTIAARTSRHRRRRHAPRRARRRRARPARRTARHRPLPRHRSRYRQLLNWRRSFGDVGRIGVEGTGSYGAALARHLTTQEITVIEVSRPNRLSTVLSLPPWHPRSSQAGVVSVVTLAVRTDVPVQRRQLLNSLGTTSPVSLGE